MSKDPFPINPWLAEKVMEYRSGHSDQEMRADYEYVCQFSDNYSWQQYHLARALLEAMRGDPFLQTFRTGMKLPEETRTALYGCHVDTVADLLQLSEEELTVCARDKGFEVKPIENYLKRHGYRFHHSPVRTRKVPSLPLWSHGLVCDYQTWVLEPPGSVPEFDIARPTILPFWFDEYYDRYEYQKGEEQLRGQLMDVKPDEAPYDSQEFFNACRDLADAYRNLAREYHLKQDYHRPKGFANLGKGKGLIPNDQFLRLKRDAAFAVISILEQSHLFRESTAEDYLRASDGGKLRIAEDEGWSEAFQQLLVSHVSVHVYFSDILIDLQCRESD